MQPAPGLFVKKPGKSPGAELNPLTIDNHRTNAPGMNSVPNRADLPRSLSTGPESPPSPSKTGSILGGGGWSPNLSKFSGAKRPTIFLCESSTAAAESVNARVRAAMQGSLVTACPGTFRVGSRQYIMKDGYRRLTTYGLFSPARCCCSVVWAWRLPCFVILRHFW